MKKSKGRNYVFTVNNKADLGQLLVDYWRLRNLTEEDLREKRIEYLACCIEVGESGNVHIQGYVEFKNEITKKGVIKKLECPLWCQERSGTREEASGYILDPNYVSKKGKKKKGDYYIGSEFSKGLLKQQGRANMLTEFYEDIKNGSSDFDLQEKCPRTYARHYKAIDRMRYNYDLEMAEEYKDIPVHVIYGPSRSGKTRYIFEKEGYKNCCKLKMEGSSLWFDRYKGEKVLILDDFYGQIRVSLMLQLLDCYKQDLQIKGGHRIARWDRIYITSNTHPSKWYTNWSSIPSSVQEAFYERITSITKKIRTKPLRGLPKEIVINENNEKVEQKFLGNNELKTLSRNQRRRKRKKARKLVSIPNEDSTDESSGHCRLRVNSRANNLDKPSKLGLVQLLASNSLLNSG